jgi:glycosyltransferase involved in cell wall biosynthesis
MSRVLQIIPTPCDFQTGRMSEMLRPLSAGLETIGRGGSLGSGLVAVRTLRQKAEAFDLLHCWDMRGLSLAAMATRKPLLLTAPPDLTRRGVRWLRAVMGYRPVTVVCASAIQHRRLVEAGIAIERCHIVRPGVDFAKIKRRRDPELRAALGRREKDVAILAPGESTVAARHELAVWMCGILEYLDPKYQLLTWGRGPAREKAATMARKLRQPHILHTAEQRLGRAIEFEDLFAAADVIVVTADEGAATLPIAQAMASALPIVSVTNYLTSELLEDRHTAAMTVKPSAKLLARRVLDVLEDRSLQWSIADRARAEAYDTYSVTRFVDEYRQLIDAAAAATRAA